MIDYTSMLLRTNYFKVEISLYLIDDKFWYSLFFSKVVITTTVLLFDIDS